MLCFRATIKQFEKPSLKLGSAPDFNKTSKCSYLLFAAATCNGAQPNGWGVWTAWGLSFKNLKMKKVIFKNIKLKFKMSKYLWIDFYNNY